MKVEVRVPKAQDLLVGDRILEYTDRFGQVINRRAPNATWTVTKTTLSYVEGQTADGSARSIHFTQGCVNWLVERDVPGIVSPAAQVELVGTFHIPAGPRFIEDWPLRCGRCGRDKSAVMLFNSVDCKYGCYSSGRKA